MTKIQEEKETERLEAFSDGIFAIAITLLVLEINVPSHGSVGVSIEETAIWDYFHITLHFSFAAAVSNSIKGKARCFRLTAC